MKIILKGMYGRPRVLAILATTTARSCDSQIMTSSSNFSVLSVCSLASDFEDFVAAIVACAQSSNHESVDGLTVEWEVIETSLNFLEGLLLSVVLLENDFLRWDSDTGESGKKMTSGQQSS